jgi:ketosteroid isomerase-like protein
VSQENVEVVRASFEAFNAGGIEALLLLAPPDLAWYPVAEWLEDPVYRGHDGARKLTAAFTENFDDWAWEVHEIRDAGDRVVVLTEMTGQIRDSGVPIRQQIGIVSSDFRDGTAHETRFFRTWQEALKAVGLEE